MKKFDTIRMMRDIRDKLVQKYLEDPELENKELKEIRKKYGLKSGKAQVKQYESLRLVPL
jgi:uncharacterized protein YneF (UPF0154 family)